MQMKYAMKEPATDKQLKMIVAKLKGMGMASPDTILQYVNAVMAENGMDQVAGSEALTKFAASKVIDALMANPAAH
jgi:hypothetical protein